jgi:hypothetical protein
LGKIIQLLEELAVVKVESELETSLGVEDQVVYIIQITDIANFIELAG